MKPEDTMPRSVLPVPDQGRTGLITYDAKDPESKYPSGTAALYVDGKPVGEGKIAATAAMVYSADDGCDVGVDTGSPVSPDYGSRGNEFTGHIKGVQLAIADDAKSHDHLVSPEEAVRIAMARQ
jgi:hypothetical protein